MKYKRLLLPIAILIVVFAVIIFWLSKTKYTSHVFVGGKGFSVEVSDTQELLEKGLSGHSPLSSDEGMLFVFQKPNFYGFWMKEMNFPIDIIWISSDLKINTIEKSLSPSSYPKIFYPVGKSLYVLEISAGQSETLGLKVGDSLKFLEK